MKHASTGFTLIEVLVAMALFAIASAATTSLMFHSTAYIAKSNERSQAIAIAQQTIEDLRTMDYSDIDSGSTTVEWKEQAAFFNIDWDVSDDDPEPNMKTIVVSVSWESKGVTNVYEIQSIYTDIDT